MPCKPCRFVISSIAVVFNVCITISKLIILRVHVNLPIPETIHLIVWFMIRPLKTPRFPVKWMIFIITPPFGLTPLANSRSWWQIGFPFQNITVEIISLVYSIPWISFIYKPSFIIRAADPAKKWVKWEERKN
jgi:hypothetical protein